MSDLRRVLLVFSALMAIGAAGLLAWANWPIHRISRTTQLHLIAPETWNEKAARQLNAIHFDCTITCSETIKIGQTGDCQLILEGLPSSISLEGDTWQLHIRSELVLPGFLNQQEGMLSQAVQQDSLLRFNWDLKANMVIRSTGTLRLYADYISGENQIETQLLSVTDLELASSSLSGLSTGAVASLAVALLLLAGLAGALGLTRPSG